MSDTPEIKVVEAVGTASWARDTDANRSRGGGRALSKAVEEAMSKAVLDCYAEGISDPAVHKERMMIARQAARTAFFSVPPSEPAA
jgi:AICAR transformylase/IMP cyclohydrolase PurH